MTFYIIHTHTFLSPIKNIFAAFNGGFTFLGGVAKGGAKSSNTSLYILKKKKNILYLFCTTFSLSPFDQIAVKSFQVGDHFFCVYFHYKQVFRHTKLEVFSLIC